MSTYLTLCWAVIVQKTCEAFWPNFAFGDRSMKLGMQFGTAIRSIFGYRDIANISRDRGSTHFQNGHQES